MNQLFHWFIVFHMFVQLLVSYIQTLKQVKPKTEVGIISFSLNALQYLLEIYVLLSGFAATSCLYSNILCTCFLGKSINR